MDGSNYATKKLRDCRRVSEIERGGRLCVLEGRERELGADVSFEGQRQP